MDDKRDKTYIPGAKKLGTIEENFADYASYVGQYELLSAEEQIELIRKYQEENDQEAFKKVINHNLRLSIFVAKKFLNSCKDLTFFDLIQEANLALIKAIKNYDLNTPNKPSGYIVTTMINNLQRQLINKGTMIRVPVHLSEIAFKYGIFAGKYFERNNCYPTEEEVISELGISKYQYKALIGLEILDTTSLNKKSVAGDSESDELVDLICDEKDKIGNKEDYIDFKIMMIRIKEKLSLLEYYIIYNRFIVGIQKPRANLGEELGVSGEYIRQVESQALFKLRFIKKNEKDVISKYSLKEIMNINIMSLSPKEVSVYIYLKENMDPVTYYFIYKKRENGYGVNDFIKEFKFLTIEEIVEEIEFCEEIEKEIFDEKSMTKIYNKTIKNTLPIRILRRDIKPTYNEEEFEKEKWVEQTSIQKEQKTYYKNIDNIDKKED